MRLSDLGITDSWKLPCWCWEPNLGSLQEQEVLLTAELFFLAPNPYFFSLRFDLPLLA